MNTFAIFYRALKIEQFPFSAFFKETNICESGSCSFNFVSLLFSQSVKILLKHSINLLVTPSWEQVKNGFCKGKKAVLLWDVFFLEAVIISFFALITWVGFSQTFQKREKSVLVWEGTCVAYIHTLTQRYKGKMKKNQRIFPWSHFLRHIFMHMFVTSHNLKTGSIQWYHRTWAEKKYLLTCFKIKTAVFVVTEFGKTSICYPNSVKACSQTTDAYLFALRNRCCMDL